MDAGLKKGHIPHPRTTASILSHLTFGWVLDIFRKGYKKNLEAEDLYDALDEHRSDFLGDEFERLWNLQLEKAKSTGKKASVLNVLVRCFGLRTLFLGLLLGATEFFLQLSQPIFLGGLINYFTPGSSTTRETAFLYAVGIIICSIVFVFARHLYSLSSFHTGMKIRVGLCSLIYRKALRLSRTALGETTVGQAVNLLSNDVNRFDLSIVFLGYIWVGPVESIIMLYVLWQEIGIAAVFGMTAILLFIPLQAFFGKMTSIYRLRVAKRTDERIRFMNEIIIGIQVIKMYAWEKPFAHLVSLTRRHEIQAITSAAYVQSFMLSFGTFGTKIAIFISIVSYVLMERKITAEKMFVVIAYFNIIKQSMTDFFPFAIAQIAEVSVSIKRIQTFLLHDEVKSIKLDDIQNKNTPGTQIEEEEKLICNHLNAEVRTNCENTKIKSAGGDSALENDKEHSSGIIVNSITAKWSADVPDSTLTAVSLSVKPKELVAVVGPVASGKTSLLHALLKELPLNKGSISVKGTISYAAQEPWLFTGSVQQNILFGESMDPERYKRVVKACALERDFHLLPHGDRTIVGERGVTLSGGQRARINLARAIYKKADIYLLDDPLSAVDAHVGRHLFDDCICNFLQDKCRVLVTHQLQYLQMVDNIFILKHGMVEATGTFIQLLNSGVDFAQQFAIEEKKNSESNELEAHSSTQLSVRKIVRQTSESSVRTPVRQISETSLKSSTNSSEPEVAEEIQAKGGVSSSVYRAYCSAGGSCCLTVFVLGACLLSQLVTSTGDYWMSYWSNVEEHRMSKLHISSSTSVNGPVDKNSNSTHLFEEDSTYNSSMSNLLGWDWLASVGAENVTLSGIGDNTTALYGNETEWLSSGSEELLSIETCIYVYSSLTAAIIVLTLGSTLLFFTMCMRASVNLHDTMFSSIIYASIDFFNNTPSGQILNRFSKDMGSVDEKLSRSMVDCVQIGLAMLGVITVVAIVNFWMLIPTAVMFILFFLLRSYYLTTSRSLKRLEGITRSPVFSHLSATLQGLSTIRAFGAQALLEKQFDNHQDLHSSCWFLCISSNRAFGLWLDSTCVIYIALVTLSFLTFSEGQSSGNVGLAITQAVRLTGMLQWGMRQSAELENNMTALERILEYTDVESELQTNLPANRKPQNDWPSKGTVLFDHVFLAYSRNDPPVLKDVHFFINSAEKVGIVGRTGAGKSSLISALFRLVNLQSGSIHIDGIDISTVTLDELRSKVSIIPQEPVLFSGTLRYNLDPFSQYSDSSLWTALEEVELKQAVDELPAGLNHIVTEGGANFSVGQRQLLCLARAILRNNKILVLDEATANVDPQTDELIQTTIHRKFSECTVLTIAHRLHTVMDSNRIIVMSCGSVVEFDHPYVLLTNKNGYLYQMVHQTGYAMAESLLKVAHLSYEKSLEQKT